MKILAIAGKNLASLTQFELRLDTAPLDREGLFAITGPTGAGKSTILDAMCVSLYDRMPRLPRSKTKLSEEEGNPFTNLTLADPRHIMRRGAKSCYAETTFLGVDGHRYKARWEVPATQRKNAKSLKKPVITLENLDQETLFVDKKRDIQELILQKVGLTFDQFCRSVFLAQGDFAAFLKADGDARAELLERMTGTEIYRDLSLAAFEREKSERDALQKLQSQMAAHAILSPEARAELEEKFMAVASKRQSAHQTWQHHHERVVGHEKTQQLQGAVQAAHAALQAAQEAKAAQAETQKALDTWEKLSAGREAWNAKKRLSAQLATRQQHQAHLSASLEEKQAQVEDLKSAFAHAQQAKADFEAEVAAQKPQLEQARKCDIQLEHAATHKRQLQEQLQHLQNRLATERQTQARHQQHLQQWQNQAKAARATLQENADFEPLLQAGKTWQQDLAAYLKTTRDIRAQALAQAAHLWQLHIADDHLDRLDQHLSRCDAGNQALEKSLRDFDRETLRVKQTQLSETLRDHQSQGHALEQVVHLHQQVLALQTTLQDAQELRESLVNKRAQRQQTLGDLQQRIDQQALRHEEAKRHLERVLLASSEGAKAMRRHLEAGKPCPVCGATEHPQQDQTGFDPLIQETRDRVNQLERTWAEKRAEFAQLERDQSYDEERLQKLDRDTEANQALRAQLAERAAPHLANFPTLVPTALGSDDTSDVLSTLRTRWQTNQQALQDQSAALEEQEGQRALLECSRELVQERLRKLDWTHQQLRERQSQTKHQLEMAQTRIEDRSQALGNLLGRLEPLLQSMPHWQRRLTVQREAFIEQLQFPVAKLEQAKQQVAQAEAGEKELLPLLAKAREAVSQGEAQLATLSEQLRTAADSWQELHQQRLQLFEGKPVQELEAAQNVRQAELNAALDQQVQRKDAAQTNLQELQAAHKEQASTIAELQEELEAWETKLHQSLQAQAVSLEEVQSLLEREPAWASEQRQALQTVTATWNRAEGSLKSAEAQLEAHLAAFEASDSLDEAIALREAAQTEKDLLESEFARLNLQQEADEKARAELGTLQHAHDAQASRWELWDGMRELIGSHDGKKFRLYAQSLTLDMLLHHANYHLNDLARRYQLERLPGADLALRVIDRDMGDEIRSVNSLSGGETFLVSLALALGLATFTTTQTPIESLFIDEGFGSLDAESLEIALDTLEALQAMGRQVGVISHVQTLVERIAAQVQVRKVGGGHSEVRIRYRH